MKICHGGLTGDAGYCSSGISNSCILKVIQERPMKKYVRNKIIKYASITTAITLVLSYVSLKFGKYIGLHHDALTITNFIISFIAIWIITNVVGLYVVAYERLKRQNKEQQ